MFLKYAYDYVSTFMGKSITTQQWKDHLYAYFAKNGGEEKIKILDSVDWDVRRVYYTTCFSFLYCLCRHGSTAKDCPFQSTLSTT